jgi:hypothetical protein
VKVPTKDPYVFDLKEYVGQPMSIHAIKAGFSYCHDAAKRAGVFMVGEASAGLLQATPSTSD